MAKMPSASTSAPMGDLVESAKPPAEDQDGEAPADVDTESDGGDEEEEDDKENDVQASEQGASAGSGSVPDTQTSRQKKKKKSKAAAKVRKKLGLGGQETSAEAASAQVDAIASSSASGKTASGQMLSDDDVAQLQQAIEKEQGPRAASRADRATLERLMKMMNLEKTALLKDQEAKQKQYKTLAEHKFWKTQPVTKPDDVALVSQDAEGPIEPNVPREQVRTEPYPLPKDFEWVQVDIDDPEQLKEVYDLLSANYVEDVDATLRFNYSPEFLNWVLKHPGYQKTWHVGVRVSSTNKLVAFISGIPHELRVRKQSYPSTEINFLCVHKKLRSKRLAPVLIKEVTRQCHLTGIFQAIYTAGIVIPTPISCARYYHRTLNPQKLLDVGFSAMPANMSKEAFFARFALPDQTRIAGLREMEEDDVPAVGRLMRRYMARFDMAARFTNKEVRHLLLSGRGGKDGKKQVTWAYVVEDPATSKITDMVSFYSLPSSVLDNDTHGVLEAGYLFYYATDVIFDGATQQAAAAGTSSASSLTTTQHTSLSVEEQQDEVGVTNWAQESPETKAKLKTRLNELMHDMLILAKRQKFDVLNCLTVMDNPLFLNEQKFGVGDGRYPFSPLSQNWRVVPIAGGMGSRAGEADLDPVMQHAKQRLEKEIRNGSTSAGDAHEHARRLAAMQPRPEMGSGNGIVMV